MDPSEKEAEAADTPTKRGGQSGGRQGWRQRNRGDEASESAKKTKYRDRAKERRQGDARSDYDVQMDEEQLRRMDVETSRLLGGDMEHTHLVRGLDLQLLAQEREKIRRQLAADPSLLPSPSSSSISTPTSSTTLSSASLGSTGDISVAQEEFATKQQPLSIEERLLEQLRQVKVQTGVGKLVMRALVQQRVAEIEQRALAGQTGVADLWRPGRMHFEFDLDLDFGRDLPATGLRPVDELPAAPQTQIVPQLPPSVLDHLAKVLPLLQGGGSASERHTGKKRRRRESSSAAAGDGGDGGGDSGSTEASTETGIAGAGSTESSGHSQMHHNQDKQEQVFGEGSTLRLQVKPLRLPRETLARQLHAQAQAQFERLKHMQQQHGGAQMQAGAGGGGAGVAMMGDDDDIFSGVAEYAPVTGDTTTTAATTDSTQHTDMFDDMEEQGPPLPPGMLFGDPDQDQDTGEEQGPPLPPGMQLQAEDNEPEQQQAHTGSTNKPRYFDSAATTSTTSGRSRRVFSEQDEEAGSLDLEDADALDADFLLDEANAASSSSSSSSSSSASSSSASSSGEPKKLSIRERLLAEQEGLGGGEYDFDTYTTTMLDLDDDDGPRMGRLENSALGRMAAGEGGDDEDEYGYRGGDGESEPKRRKMSAREESRRAQAMEKRAFDRHFQQVQRLVEERSKTKKQAYESSQASVRQKILSGFKK